MTKVTKRLGLFTLAVLFSVCLSTGSKAQTPANDPGIFGPGSPGNGPQGDGSPVVPFDGGMSLMLLASGVGYVAKKMKANQIATATQMI